MRGAGAGVAGRWRPSCGEALGVRERVMKGFQQEGPVSARVSGAGEQHVQFRGKRAQRS